MITFSQLGNTEYGRLGNQLFQIAATLGIAYKNRQNAVFPEWSYSKYFANSIPLGNIPNARKYKYIKMAYKPIDLPVGDWDINGFFTSEKYFIDISERIRRIFAPSEQISTYIDKKYGNILSQETCSIHVRRGDYLNLKGSFPSMSIEYYKCAIDFFSKNTKFLVFSDDIDWCKKQFIGKEFTFIEGELDVIDIFIMSRCKNHIISNSTFGWWGAWLNNNSKKVVLCPTWWVGPSFSAFPEKYSKDIYANGFTPVSPPGEKKWLIRTYYFLSHPFFSLEYKYKLMSSKIILKILKIKRLSYLIKKTKKFVS